VRFFVQIVLTTPDPPKNSMFLDQLINICSTTPANSIKLSPKPCDLYEPPNNSHPHPLPSPFLPSYSRLVLQPLLQLLGALPVFPSWMLNVVDICPLQLLGVATKKYHPNKMKQNHKVALIEKF